MISVEHIRVQASQIRAWATMAASAYGTYSGINPAIHEAKDKTCASVYHADRVRQHMALMAVVRVFALLDRNSDTSLQAMNRLLQEPVGLERIAESYASSEPPSSLSDAERNCAEFVERFRVEYAQINWSLFGRLQSFRNGAIAHISRKDVESRITYGQLEEFTRRPVDYLPCSAS